MSKNGVCGRFMSSFYESVSLVGRFIAFDLLVSGVPQLPFFPSSTRATRFVFQIEGRHVLWQKKQDS